MSTANIQINIEDASIKELNEEIARLTEELEGTSRATEEGRKRIAALGGEINKLQGEVTGIQDGFKKVDVGQLVGEIGKVAAGLGAAGAALSSFGADNEEVAEILEKTNAILALAATAEALYTVTNKESTIALAAKQAATTAASVAQSAYTAVVGTSTGALKLFRLALVATGIGAIIVGIGLLVANWDKLTKAITNSEGGLSNFGKALLFILGPVGLIIIGLDKIAQSVGGWQNLFAAISGVVTTFFTQFSEIMASAGKVLQGVFTLDLDLINEGLDQGKKIFVDGAKAAVEEAEAERRKRQELENAKNNQALLDYEAQKAKILGKSREEIFQAERAAAQNRLRAAELEYGKNSDEYRKAELDLLKITEDFNKQQADEEKKAADERLRKTQERNDALLAAERALRDKELTLFDLSQEEKLKAIDENLTAELKSIRKSAKSKAEILALTEAAELQATFDRVKLAEEEQQRLLQIAKETNDAVLENLRVQAELAGDADAVQQIQEQILAQEKAFATTSANITAQTIATVNSLTVTGESQQRLIQESLTRIEGFSTEFTTTVTKANREAFDEITASSIASAFQTNAEAVKISIDQITLDYDTLKQAISPRSILENLGQSLKDNLDLYKEYGFNILNAERANQLKRLELIKQEALARNAVIDEEIRKIQEKEAVQQEVFEQQLQNIENEKKEIESKLEDENLSYEKQEELKIRLQQLDAERAAAEAKRASDAKANEDAINKLLEEQIENTGKAVEATESQVKSLKEFLKEDFVAVIQAVTDLLASSLEFINQKISAISSSYDREIKKASDFYDRLIEAAGENASEVARLEQQKDEALVALEAQKNDQIADLQIKAARTQFALDIGNAITAAAVGFNRAFSLGPIAGTIAAALIAASTGIQIATAKSARDQAIAEANALRSSGGSGSLNVRTQFATGGFVSGPGTATSDSIPAMLSNGEFVVNARATSQNLPLLESINNSIRPQKFFAGGLVGDALSANRDKKLQETLDKIDQKLDKPLRAYVVTSDIRDGINNEEYLERRSQLT
jgi:hypothetical protein